MRRLTVWWLLYRSGSLLQYFALVGASLVGAAQKVKKPDDLSPFWRSLVEFGQDYGLALPILGVLGLVAKLTCDSVGPPWVWDAVQKVIDKFADKAFETSPGAPVHEYRVTLFRRTWALVPPWSGMHRLGACWRWPWSGWLVPVVRSGFTTQSTRTVFLAPDDAYNAEGVAGQTWARRQVFQTSELPDVKKTPTDENIKAYADKTFVPEKWVRDRLREGKPFPMTLCGIPIEVGGKVWGVLVLDSQHPQAIKDKAHLYKAYLELLPTLLAELLKHRV